jgi:large subunit ribosomal protein L33
VVTGQWSGDPKGFLTIGFETEKRCNMAKENREMVWLQCTETGDLNYRTQIKVAGGVQKVELKKYNPRLRKHTLHKVKRK